jgi:predicted hotdog family 3-hydroxylacyl-ACP dehydratase
MLLDRVIADAPEMAVAEVVITPDSLFFVDGCGVPVHVGMEYMAQTCGVFAGLRARKAGKPIRLGFLLGTRRYRADGQWFRDGERLAIVATQTLLDQSLGVFDCAITVDGLERARAQLTVYQPPEDEDNA